MKDQNKEVLYGLYDDEQDLLKAVKQANEDHLEIMDVFTPFPVHGLDPLLGLEESRLHIAGFIYGAIGTLTAFLFMTWVFTRDWPIIFGGKPYWSVPAFVPITFEVTVLFASVGMVVTFYTICGLAPGVVNPTLDDRITDDKFCIAFNTNDAGEDKVDKLKSFFSATGASEVNTKTI
ncbi:MAG: membrane protein [Saprospiraceae bacterium]|nr:MAG: membrane protein [Saprospiraceae bacterium]